MVHTVLAADWNVIGKDRPHPLTNGWNAWAPVACCCLDQSYTLPHGQWPNLELEKWGNDHKYLAMAARIYSGMPDNPKYGILDPALGGFAAQVNSTRASDWQPGQLRPTAGEYITGTSSPLKEKKFACKVNRCQSLPDCRIEHISKLSLRCWVNTFALVWEFST